MSHINAAIPLSYDAPAPRAVDDSVPDSAYVPRTWAIPATLLIPVLMCGVSWLLDGAGPITDLGFISLAVISAIFLASEFYYFPRRFGIGGMCLFGGILVWFCYDYFTFWLGANFATGLAAYKADVVAKAAFYHAVFFCACAAGLMIRRGRWLAKLISSVPDVPDRRAYLILIVFLSIVGIAPYFIFTSEPFYVSLYKAVFSGRSQGAGAVQWTVGRTGNTNTSYGGYVAQILQVGEMSAILAAVYMVFVARTLPTRVFCGAIWLFWLLISIGGTRGSTVFFILPVVGLLYIKYQAKVADLARKFSWRAHLLMFGLLLLIVIVVQVQSHYRNLGYGNADLSQVSLTKLQGNAMFSESLPGFARVPEVRNYFYDNFPGEVVVMPIPDTIKWFFISPIPRAFWTSKPIDPVWAWYNEVVTGKDAILTGTTIAQGAVGYWFLRFGFWGVLEGGLLTGWLMVTCERVLQNARGRIISLLLALALITFMFRCFRGLNFGDVHGIIVGTVAFVVISAVIRMFTGEVSEENRANLQYQ